MGALVLQCGGPTTVVNTTLAAIVRRWRIVAPGQPLYGGRYGLAALSTGDWLPLDPYGDDWLSTIEASPGMALGGGRDRPGEQDLRRAAALLASRSVGALFLIGGNGTMAAGRALHAAAEAAGIAARVVGVPKTIDNDIPATDVCPGFPSGARFLIEAVKDVAADVTSMRGYEDVVLVEAMGRHTGWLAAATLLARSQPGDAPHLVLVPEQPVSEDVFLDAVGERHARGGICVVTVAEGVRDAGGKFLAERGLEREVERDAAGQVILGRSGGPLPYLASLVRRRLGLRCRLVRPDVLQRCSRAHIAPIDRTIAAMTGAAAVDYAATDRRLPAMIALKETPEGWQTEAVPLDQVRGERTLPDALCCDPEPLRRLIA
jgi:ATP-dependent phosphofructokinase / diphosphate-dependent phosphofructokinase